MARVNWKEMAQSLLRSREELVNDQDNRLDMKDRDIDRLRTSLRDARAHNDLLQKMLTAAIKGPVRIGDDVD